MQKDKSYLYLSVFILFHITLWTLIPSIARYNLPLDAIEGTVWGQHLTWGYDKNPFLSAWITQLAIQFSHTGWTTYLASQMAVGICFLTIWLFAKKILPPRQALIAVMLLEGVQYYHLHAIDLSDNALELGIWAPTILFFYRALRENKCWLWIITGVLAGLCLMTKYYGMMLLLSLLIFLLIHPEARTNFKNPYLYYGLFAFMLIIFPHVFWLSQHDFSTLHYAFHRVSVQHAHWTQHFIFPLKFLLEQLETFLPAFLLLCGLFIFNFSRIPILISSYDKIFLYCVSFIPLLATLLFSLLGGFKLRAAWGQPLLSLWGIMAVYWLQPAITSKQFQRFYASLFLLMLLLASTYWLRQKNSSTPASANFPGPIIARIITEQWQQQYHTPLTYVVGSRWLAGNIAFYSVTHPQVFIDGNKKLSPWIDEKKLRAQGAVFVWEKPNPYLHHRKTTAFSVLKKQFSALSSPMVMHFTWLDKPQSLPYEIEVAMLPPANMVID